MNSKGVFFLAGIPVLAQILVLLGVAGVGLYVADTVGLFGNAVPYGACGLGSFGKPCPMGYFCDNAFFVSGSCQPVQGLGGFWDRLLGSLSLNNLFCGQSGILAPFCNIALPLLSVFIVVAILLLVVLLVAPTEQLAIYGAVVLGVIFGLGFYSFVSLYWWLLIVFGIVAAIVGYFLVDKGVL